MSTRIPQRPASALAAPGASCTRTVGSILSEQPTTGYVRRPRQAASASATRSSRTSSRTKVVSDLWTTRSTLAVGSAHASPPHRPRHSVRSADLPSSVASHYSHYSHYSQDHRLSQRSAEGGTEPTAYRRQAPLSLHRSLFADVLLQHGSNTLVKRIIREPEAAFLHAARAMAARLGLRVLRETDLLFLLLSVFHNESVDEQEARYLFKYVDFRSQGVIDLRDVLDGLATLFRPYNVTAALWCKRLASGQLPGESLVTLDELTRMLDGVQAVFKGHPRVDATALANVQSRLVSEVEAVQLDHCVPAATAHRFLKREATLTQILAYLDWNGKVLLPLAKESDLERLLKDGVSLQGAPAASRRRAARDLRERSDENHKILDYIHEIYTGTLLGNAAREPSTERPIDATHPRFVADKYINRSRIASCVV